ncbi:MAG: SDR family oxidoreductase, partial [Nevskiales bacterium]|nr:SDR family oxidoreductase [Nevskiales bacterium]
MNYFITGATGFIGRFLVERLLQRSDAQIYVLVRKSSADKYKALEARWPAAAERVRVLWGDVTRPGLVSAADREKLTGTIDHVFHLAALYDMNMADAPADRINNEGTRNVVRFVNGLGGHVRLHHVSSVAVAGGDYVGKFTEEMFDQSQPLHHPYFRTKFQSEAIVRDECRAPFRIYRPGMVVGHSQTGEMTKIDGPYYFFKAIQRIRDTLPRWLPLLGVDGGKMPLAPVDYVVDALDAIAHQEGHDGKCFHLLQANSPSVGELIRTLLEVAHGPEIAASLALPRVPEAMKDLAGQLVSRIPINLKRRIARAIGVPASVLGYVNSHAVFDDSQARAALKGTGIECPEFKRYAKRLWQYWESHLDLKVRIPPRARQKLSGKVVIVTGASSGIGFVTARKLAAAGAKVILVARTESKLETVQRMIRQAGGEAHVYPCDLSNLEDIDRMSAEVLRHFDHVDILINNAGRSIRRGVMEPTTQFHDFERTMQLNYFGAVRLILALLPGMAHRKSGHIVNVSSIGVLANAARFSAYVASKAALDAFSRCVSAEVKHLNIEVTAIYMPLVRTPMIAPTKIYNHVPSWSPEKAADTVMQAILDRPKSIATPLGTAAAVSYALWP